MSLPLTLGVSCAAAGGWSLTLIEVGASPVSGVVTPELVQEVFAARATGRPGEVGALLGQALARCPSILARVYAALGSARERREPTSLLLRCDDARVLSLPWERCVDPSGALWEAEEPLCIVRVLPGPASAPGREHAELHLGGWGLPPGDSLMASLTALCGALGLSAPLSFTGPVEAALLNTPDAARMLHLDAPIPEDPLPPSLRAALPSVTAVVVHGDPAPWAVGVSALLNAGAAAVLTGVPQEADAAREVLGRVYRRLLSGAGLPEAVKDARVSIPALAGDLILAVADVAALSGVVVRERWTPQGWPRPSAEVGAVLQGALELAQQLASGFVGLEHIVLSLCRPAPRGRVAERLRFMLSMRREGVRERLSSYELLAPENAEALGTPRLRSLADRLTPGFEMDTLWALLRDDVSALLNATARPSPASETTLMSGERETASQQVARKAAVATRLEVLGGPEDGRVLRLEVGEALGRASVDGSSQQTLYGGTALTDRHLSRRQLRWLGEGRVELISRAKALHRPGGIEPLSDGAVQLYAGDVIALTRVTWLRGLSD